MNEDRQQPGARSSTRRVVHDLPGAVAIWAVDLDRHAAVHDLAGLPGALLERADSQTTRRAGRRLLAAHHALRVLVGEFLGRDPRRLAIHRDRLGKLALADAAVSLNHARSGGWAFVGLGAEVAIGVDLEVVRPVPELAGLVDDHLLPDERAAWCLARGLAADRMFLRCWTRKEACAKALGVGLRLAPGEVAAGCDPARRTLTVRAPGASAAVTVTSLELGGRLVGAAAITSPAAARTLQAALGGERGPDSPS